MEPDLRDELQKVHTKLDTLAVKIDERFDKLAQRIDFSERQAQQMVELVSERVHTVSERLGRLEERAERAEDRGDTLERSLTTHEGTMHAGTRDHIHRLERDQAAIQGTLETEVAGLDARIREQEAWRSRVVGIALGAALGGGTLGGGVAIAILKAIGGAG